MKRAILSFLAVVTMVATTTSWALGQDRRRPREPASGSDRAAPGDPARKAGDPAARPPTGIEAPGGAAGQGSSLEAVPLSPAQKERVEKLRADVQSATTAFDTYMAELQKATKSLTQDILPRLRADPTAEVRAAGKLKEAFELVAKAGEALLAHKTKFPEQAAIYEAKLREVAGELEKYAAGLRSKSGKSPLMAPYYAAAANAVSSTAVTFAARADGMAGQAETIQVGFTKVEQIVAFARDVLPTLDLIQKGSEISAEVRTTLENLRQFAAEFDKAVQAFVILADQMKAAPPPQI